MATVAKQEVGELKESILDVLDELGGITQFVQQGETVLVKPNFNTADPPPASTDMEFLMAVVQIIYEAGAGKVIVGESSTFSQSTAKNMEKKGVDQLLQLSPAPEILNFDDAEWVKKQNPDLQYLKSVRMPKILDEVDKIIFVPCLKTHAWAQYTGALKLSVGMMHPKERMALHARRLQEKIGDLNSYVSPDLVIMDARLCYITDGPSSGEVREPNLVMASTDRISIDIDGINVIKGFEGNDLADIEPEEMTQIKVASQVLAS